MMKSLILSVAVHGQTRWLGVLLRKQTDAFFQSMNGAIEGNEVKIVEILLMEIAAELRENAVTLTEPILLSLLNAFEILSAKSVKEIGGKFNEVRWIDINKKMVAICDVKGMVWVYMCGKNHTLIKGNFSVSQSGLVRVSVDPSGGYIWVTVDPLRFVVLKVTFEDDKVSMTSIWSKTVEADWSGGWTGPGQLQIGSKTQRQVRPEVLSFG
jgi:hypothetical protein